MASREIKDPIAVLYKLDVKTFKSRYRLLIRCKINNGSFSFSPGKNYIVIYRFSQGQKRSSINKFII